MRSSMFLKCLQTSAIADQEKQLEYEKDTALDEVDQKVEDFPFSAKYDTREQLGRVKRSMPIQPKW